jgi:hypothetical protein
MRFPFLLTVASLSAASLLIVSCGDKLDPVCDGSTPVYNVEVKPIITSNCLGSSCHGAGSPDGDFTTFAGISTVTSNGKFTTQVLDRQTMPQNGTLTQAEINTLQCWANNGFKEK